MLVLRTFLLMAVFDVQNISCKRSCVQPHRMALIDLRNVHLEEEDEPYRKGSCGNIRSEVTGSQCYAKHGSMPLFDSVESLDSKRSSAASAMRIRRISSICAGSTRFPKLEECAHFHYDIIELGQLNIELCNEEREHYHHNGAESPEIGFFLVRVTSNDKSWTLHRTYRNFRMLDRQLHNCIVDRKISSLVELAKEDEDKPYNELEITLSQYLERFSELAGRSGTMMNCGSITNWLEIDNRGNHILAFDDTGINTPAIAAAHTIKRYSAQANDEISLEVGDIVSVIDMPPAEDNVWWRGKRGFEVGFFPRECVEVIGDKVPASVTNRIPQSAINSKKPIVRKHWKFLSFLRMFFSTRPARNQLKQSGIVKERVFGCDLGEHLLNSGHEVPLVLKCCTEVIEENGIVDGIYRLSGINSNIQRLRLAFDEDRVPDLTSDNYIQDIHSISSLLKMYFRELPNPLLTYHLYEKFADAVRDEENKLLKIHDVVQQLPPPHYRTTEYLMRHLARVAAQGHDTGMHSKNLAIVWAPNLLRSKELETGGGAAALQGVGIQAVVTEFLICYADLIFSDKMPSYNSPEMRKVHKKPRPKSLAISTPTRLLTLEEARERALSTNLKVPSQKYIDVGGGPESIPAKYHTVIDLPLPGYKKRVQKDGGPTKNKKSPVSGWKSLFSRSRSGSIKQKGGRKSSMQDAFFADRKAITEEDVQHWKRRRLRGAKSVESLVSMPSSVRSSTTYGSKNLDGSMVVNLYTGDDQPTPTRHKRSLSSDASGDRFHSTDSSLIYQSFIDEGTREMPIDVDVSVTPDFPTTNSNDNNASERKTERVQSFVRSDSKRRVIHRRIPSTPSTPKQEREKCAKYDDENKENVSLSQSGNSDSDRQSSNELRDSSEKFVVHMNKDTCTAKSVEHSHSNHSLNAESGDKRKSSRHSPKDLKSSKDSRTSPKQKKKKRELKERVVESQDNKKENEKVPTLPESPGARRKQRSDGGCVASVEISCTPSPKKYYYSTHHDYAEILSDEETAEIVSDQKYSQTVKRLSAKLELTENKDSSTQQHEYADNVIYAKIKNSKKEANKKSNLNNESRTEILNFETEGKIAPRQDLLNEISNLERSIKTMQQYPNHPHMSKCLSIPSDIQRSLENINVSQMDLMSSITISELSQSVDSFNVNFNNLEINPSPIRGRSVSIDGSGDLDSPFGRTLKDINDQIDSAFREKREKTSVINKQANYNVGDADLDKDNLLRETHFYDNADLTTEKGNKETLVDQITLTVEQEEELCASLYDNYPTPDETVNVEEVVENSFQHSNETDKNYGNVYISQKSEIKVVDVPPMICAPQQPSANVVVDIVTSSADMLEATVNLGKSGDVKRDDLVYKRPPLKQTMSLDTASAFRSLENTKHSRSALRHGLSLDLDGTSPEYTEAKYKNWSWNYSPLTSPQEGKVCSPTDLKINVKSSSKHESLILSPSTPTEPCITGVAGADARKGRGSPKSKSNRPRINIVSGQLPSPLGSPLRTSAVTEIDDIMAADASDIERLQRQESVESPSTKSSPKSPRQQQEPRWEDLAGLNQNFHDICTFDEKIQDLANFNEMWRQQLTPTGDSIRQSNFSEGFTIPPSPVSECPCDHVIRDRIVRSHRLTPQTLQQPCGNNDGRDRTPEIGTEDKILVMEKPTIKKSTTDSSLHVKPDTLNSDFPASSVHDRSCFAQERSRSLDSEGLTHAFTNETASAAKRREQFVLQHSSSSESYHHKQESPKSRKMYSSDQLPQSVCESAQNIDRNVDSRATVQQTPVVSGGFVITRQSSQSESSTSVTVDTTGRKSQSVSQSAAVLKVSAQASGQSVNQSESLASVSAISVNKSNEVAVSSSMSAISICRNNQSDVASVDIKQSEATGNWLTGNEGNHVKVPFDRTALDTILNDDRPMLEEIDINESCFGLPSHQNLSNELKEKIDGMNSQQDRMQEILSPNFPKPFIPNLVHDVDMLHEVQNEIDPLWQCSVDTVQELSEVPCGDDISTARPELDTSEEMFQNAINTGREMMNMARRGDSTSENPEMHDNFSKSHITDKCDVRPCPNTIDMEKTLTGAVVLSPTTRLSPSENFSIQPSSSPTSKSFPWSKESQMFGTDVIECSFPPSLPQLAPPELELLEVQRPCIQKSKSPKMHLNLEKSSPNKQIKSTVFPTTSEIIVEDYFGSERGEAKLVIESRPCVRRKVQTIRAEKIPQPARRATKLSDTDVASLSAQEDDVFIDSNDMCEVDSMALDFGAEKEANYIDRYSFNKVRASSDHSNKRHKPVLDKCSDTLSNLLCDPPTRCSLDESVLQMASARHGDFDAFNLFQERNEDIRLTKAHKSIKLQSLCELFEDATGQKLPPQCSEKSKCKISSSPEQNVAFPEQIASEIPNIKPSNSPTLNEKRRSWSRERGTKSESEQEINKQLPSPTFRPHLPAYEKWQPLEPHRSPGSSDQGVEYLVRKPSSSSETFCEKQSPGSARPPICRPSSRTRTPSDSSLTESEGTRSHSSGSPKYIRPDGSPQSSRSESSPKTRKQCSPQFARIESGVKVGKPEESVRNQRLDKFVHNQAPCSERPRLHSEKGSPTGIRHKNQFEEIRTSAIMTDGKSEPLTNSNLERRGSVKELTELFEYQQPNSSPEQVIKHESQEKLNRSRVRSVSPSSTVNSENHPREIMLTANVRHSLEITPGTLLSHTEGILRPQTLRLGPKPFYGVKK